jgi:hypothetical protein
MKEDDSDDWKKLASVGAFDTAYTAKNLKTGKQYKFAVAAENKIASCFVKQNYKKLQPILK